MKDLQNQKLSVYTRLNDTVLRIYLEHWLMSRHLFFNLKSIFVEPVSTVNIEWEYMPGYSIRSPNSYVGLKNGGATCYMNSVFQQVRFILSSFSRAGKISGYSINSYAEKLAKS